MHKGTFTGRSSFNSPHRRLAFQQQRKLSATVSACAATAPDVKIPHYPDPGYIKAVIAAFPAQGTCNADEA
ncbi:hypothetical protein NADE_002405 [Nannochloris sp. 'desiccata']|nr:hypothetical protein NADE_002405 [Chlorella desiccata (nom. nud.)]